MTGLCWSKNPDNYEVCSVCGEERSVQTRNERQEPVCPNCNRMDSSKRKKCAKCGKKKRGAMSKKEGKYQGKFLCSNCRQKEFPKLRKCRSCKEKKVIKAIGRCDACYQRQRRRNKKLRRLANST